VNSVNSLFKRICSKLAWLVCWLIIISGVLLSIARLYIPLLDNHREQFAYLAGKALGKPVVIGKLTASWYHFEPVLQFQDVTALNLVSDKPLITISQMTVGLDLLKSLWHQRLEPDIFILKGSRLSIEQAANGQITLNGIKTGQAGNESSVSMDKVIAWLFSHGNLVLQDIELKLQLKKQLAKQITIRTVSLTNQGSKHYLRGRIILEHEQTNPLHFAADITSSGAQSGLKTVKFYAQIKALALDKLSLDKQFGTTGQSWKVANGTASAKIWGLWADGKWQQLQTTLHLQDLMVKHEQQWFNLNELQGNFWLERLGGQWELTADKLLVTMDGKAWQENQLQARLVKQAEHMQLAKLQLRYIDLAQVIPILLRTKLLPANWQVAMQGLQPQGELVNLTWQQPSQNLTLAASFHNLRFKQWQHIPGVTGLSGSLRLLSDTGQLQIQGRNSQLSVMPLFAGPLSLQQWQARVYMHKNAEGWAFTSPSITGNNQELAFHAAMSLFVPNHGESPDIQLLAAIKAPSVNRPADYYPVGIMHKPLLSWLQSAVVKANDITGTLILRGKLHDFPYHKASGVFNVLGQVNDGELHYYEGWPKISSLQAQMDFTGTGMQILATKGNIQGSQIQYAKASIANFYIHPDNNLQIEGQISGDASQAMTFLQQSPLQDRLGKHLEPLHLQGAMSTKLSLLIPLAKTVQEDIKVSGETQLQEAKLAIPMTSTWLEQVTGKFNFSEQGLLGGKLSAMWFDQPLQIDISHKAESSKLLHTQISLHGLAPIQELIKFYGWSFLAKVTGQTPFAANLQLSKNAQGSFTQSLTMTTDLQDLAIPLPGPFAKNMGVAKPTSISLMTSEDKPSVLSWNYNKQFVGSVKLQNTATGIKLEQGAIELAEHAAKLPLVQSGINIVARFQQFEWLKWQPWLAELAKYTTTDGESQASWQLRLHANKLLALGQTLHHSLVNFKLQHKYWTLAIASDEAHGNVILPQSKVTQPIILDFDKLYLQKNSIKTGASLEVKDIPALVFSCEDLRYGGKEFGNVQLTVEPMSAGINFPKLLVSNAAFTLDAQGNWQQLDKQDYTHMQGKLAISNLVQTLRLLDINSVINSNGEAKFNLDWLAKPYTFELASLQGDVELKLGAGQITSINSAAAAKIGMGKLINILGVESLTRKLTLNFRDLTDKGFSFERMRGNFSLVRGAAYTENAYFDGNIAYVGFKGRLGLASKDYDLALKVTPYLTSSIPVIAAIAGGPIVGAVSLIADRLIKHEMDRGSAYNYRLTGTWEQPQLVPKKT
jgi:uncharacterized protein (TIGR02099 family)